MKVTVLDRALHDRLWGKGYRSIQQVLCTVEIADTCPACGGPRGKPSMRRYCENDEWYDVSNWDNPCGHVDYYSDVLEEASRLVPREP